MNNNKNHEQEAIDLCMYWEKGFNERNRDICIEAMHFPHVRLWENSFSIFHVAEDFLKGFDQSYPPLYIAYIILLCTGFNPSLTSGKARLTITLIA